MAEPIVYIDRSEIRPGRLEEVKRAVSSLVEFVDKNEPQLIFYGFYIDEESSAMTVVAVHPDSSSLEFHMKIGGPEFRKLADSIDLRSIDVYGQPTPTVLDQLQQKARMLGEGSRVVAHELHSGFSRFSFSGS